MPNNYGALAWSFFKIGLFGFGGGYAILPLIGHEVVETHGWITTGEFSDMLALSQMTPGPVAINTATYVGYTMEGFWGSALATTMVCLAPFILMYVVCRFFMSMKDHPRVAGVMALLRPVVVGLVLAAFLTLLNRENFVDWKSGIVFAVAFVLSVMKIHPIPVLVAAGVFGWFAY